MKVERIELEETETAEQTEERGPGYRALVELRADESASVGRDSVRVISPRGMSNAHPFVVTNHPVVLEGERSHHTLQNPQEIPIPVLVSGRLSEKGEADYYTFEALPGQQIAFHAVSNQATKAGGFDAMQLTLYEYGSSWFDPNRPTRLRFSDEARMTYKFTKRSRYLLEVSGFVGISGPTVAYLLRVAPMGASIGSSPSSDLPELQNPGIELVKREFCRNLEPNRVEVLLGRTVAMPRPEAATAQAVPSAGVREGGAGRDRGSSDVRFPVAAARLSKSAAGSLEPPQPLFLEGAIDRPGKVDNYKLKIKAGQRLAFEVETPEATLPEFNPKVELLDASGQEVFNNIWRRVGGDNNQWMKTLQSKTMYTFNRNGEYTLCIQDITPRYGSSSFKYRLLIRPLVPHVGKIELKEDSINLAPGQAGRLTITVEQEEGYSGEVAFSLENLPSGVQASTGADVPPDPEPPLDQGKKEQYMPKSQKVTILVVGSQGAPPTTLPQVARLVARPVVQGQVGAPVWSKEIPVMVLERDSAEQTRKGS